MAPRREELALRHPASGIPVVSIKGTSSAFTVRRWATTTSGWAGWPRPDVRIAASSSRRIENLK